MIPAGITLNLNKPGHSRQLYLIAEPKLRLFLSLVYLHNDLCSKAGAQFAGAKRAQTPSYGSPSQASINRYMEEGIAFSNQRKLLSKHITEVSKYFGFIAKRNVSGRVTGLRWRVSKAHCGKTGKLIGFNQKGLFCFAGLWEEAGKPNLINSDMFR